MNDLETCNVCKRPFFPGAEHNPICAAVREIQEILRPHLEDMRRAAEERAKLEKPEPAPAPEPAKPEPPTPTPEAPGP